MRLAVTGISSYLARTLFPLLEADDSIEEIRGLDLKKPRFTSNKLSFVKCDVRDKDLAKHLQGCDAVVHLAFIVMPIRDEKEADDININGSANVFRAAAEAGIRKIVHLSSVAAYGSWPDNPEVITEDVPVKGMPEFYYSRSKAAVEKFLDGFEKEHPDIIITRFRPCIFIGPTIDNAVKYLAGRKTMAAYKDLDSRLQFVWDEDVAQAIHLALSGDFHGAYNIAGDGSVSMEDMAEIMGAKVKYFSYSFAWWISKITWALRIGPLSPGWVEVSRYSILVSTEKAKKEMGWKPKYDTAGAFKRLLDTIPSA